MDVPDESEIHLDDVDVEYENIEEGEDDDLLVLVDDEDEDEDEHHEVIEVMKDEYVDEEDNACCKDSSSEKEIYLSGDNATSSGSVFTQERGDPKAALLASLNDLMTVNAHLVEATAKKEDGVLALTQLLQKLDAELEECLERTAYLNSGAPASLLIDQFEVDDEGDLLGIDMNPEMGCELGLLDEEEREILENELSLMEPSLFVRYEEADTPAACRELLTYLVNQDQATSLMNEMTIRRQIHAIPLPKDDTVMRLITETGVCEEPEISTWCELLSKFPDLADLRNQGCGGKRFNPRPFPTGAELLPSSPLPLPPPSSTVPDVPEVTEILELEITDINDELDAPDMQEVIELSEVGEISDVIEISGAADDNEVSDILGVDDVPEMSEVLEISELYDDMN